MSNTVAIEGLRIERQGKHTQVIVVINGLDHKIWDADTLFVNESINLHASDIIRATKPQGDDNHSQMMNRVKSLVDAPPVTTAPNPYNEFFELVVKFLEGKLDGLKDRVPVCYAWQCKHCRESGNFEITDDVVRQSLSINSLARAVMDVIEAQHFYKNGMQCIKKDFILLDRPITATEILAYKMQNEDGSPRMVMPNPNFGFEPESGEAFVVGTPHTNRGKSVIDILSDGEKLYVVDSQPQNVDNRTELNAICSVCGNHFHQGKVERMRTVQDKYPVVCSKCTIDS